MRLEQLVAALASLPASSSNRLSSHANFTSLRVSLATAKLIDFGQLSLSGVELDNGLARPVLCAPTRQFRPKRQQQPIVQPASGRATLSTPPTCTQVQVCVCVCVCALKPAESLARG